MYREKKLDIVELREQKEKKERLKLASNAFKLVERELSLKGYLISDITIDGKRLEDILYTKD